MAEAWVRFDTNGQAIPVTYVRSDTEVYRDALGKDYQALLRLAGILAHERWHYATGPTKRALIPCSCRRCSTCTPTPRNWLKCGEP
jgi:hypothetical protein